MYGRQVLHRQVLSRPRRKDRSGARCKSSPPSPMRVGGLIFLILATVPMAAAQTQLTDRLNHPIHSLLLEKESPVLGIRWAGELLVDAPLGNEPTGAEVTLRQARLKFHRKLNNDWQVKLSADYNKGGKFEVHDSYALYAGWQTNLIKIGFYTPPFGLEAYTGSSALTFMEEALPVAALAERRSGGLNVLKRTASSIYSASLVAANPQQDGLSGSGQAVVLHYVHSPIDIAGREAVNLGGSFSYRVNTTSPSTRFRSRPEVATANTYFVDTGTIDGASEVIRAGVEVGQVRGRFSWQSEIMASRVKRDEARTLDFSGAYLFFSWFLTQDTRNYDLGQGKFVQQHVANPFPGKGWGAFEIGVRGSFVDLQDGDVNGGREKNLTLGINWYLNDWLRVAFNVVKVLEVHRPGSEFDGIDPVIWAVRAQWLVL